MVEPFMEAAGIEPASRHLPNPANSDKVSSESRKGQSYVYFIRGADLIKIGVARNPYKRMTDMQTGSPVKLEMMGFYPGAHKKERELHKRFNRARSHGEWFDPHKMTGLLWEIERGQSFAAMPLDLQVALGFA